MPQHKLQVDVFRDNSSIYKYVQGTAHDYLAATGAIRAKTLSNLFVEVSPYTSASAPADCGKRVQTKRSEVAAASAMAEYDAFVVESYNASSPHDAGKLVKRSVKDPGPDEVKWGNLLESD